MSICGKSLELRLKLQVSRIFPLTFHQHFHPKQCNRGEDELGLVWIDTL
jgi:hypothetical protein